MAKAMRPKQVRQPLFDQIFKPEVIKIGNHSVLRPRSRAPLIWLVLIGVVWASVVMTGFDVGAIVKRGHQFTVILEKVFLGALTTLKQTLINLFLALGNLGILLARTFYNLLVVTPENAAEIEKLRVFAPENAMVIEWGYLSKVVAPLLDTIKMSVMGSVIGSTLALPFAVLASANINRNRGIVVLLRILLNVVRTLPTLVIASICALVFNLGTFAGTVAITLFTFGIVAKMLYESIETIDMGAFEAMEALGASKFQAFWSACMPQILPTYLSHCLYSFEINVRAASILGYVGAGGLGILINERIGWRDYEGLGTVLIALFVVVLIIENTSQFLRRKLS